MVPRSSIADTMAVSYYATTGAKLGLKAFATALLARSNKFALVDVPVFDEGRLPDMHIQDNGVHLSNPVIPIVL